MINHINFLYSNIVLFRPEYKMFPVKLTDPVTGILYLTYDKKHMEDLKHAIHVKEVLEGTLKCFVYLFYYFK